MNDSEEAVTRLIESGQYISVPNMMNYDVSALVHPDEDSLVFLILNFKKPEYIKDMDASFIAENWE